MSEKQAALLVAAMAAALLAVAIVMPFSGIQPYGEDVIQTHIAQQDNALCAKLGFTDANDPRAAECMAELANLRQRHERLLVAYGLF